MNERLIFDNKKDLILTIGSRSRVKELMRLNGGEICFHIFFFLITIHANHLF